MTQSAFSFRQASSIGLLLSVIAIPAARLAADNQQATHENDKAPNLAKLEKHAFLGVFVEDLHPAFAYHFPGIGGTGQGLLVQSVSSDSPAARKGIKPHDILMTYDDQKLFSPEQLLKLVAADQTGREVKLGLIREGKQETVTVQLAERPSHEVWRDDVGRRVPPRLRNPWREPPARANWPTDGNVWDQFDELTLKKLDQNRFHASIAYTDKGGKLQKHDYEGTREEIQRRIDEDHDLTPAERRHLMRSLGVTGLPRVLTPDEWLEF